jgi:hypothetical protein
VNLLPLLPTVQLSEETKEALIEELGAAEQTTTRNSQERLPKIICCIVSQITSDHPFTGLRPLPLGYKSFLLPDILKILSSVDRPVLTEYTPTSFVGSEVA